MLRKFRRSSIKRPGWILDKWLKINRCLLCTAATLETPWCQACEGDLPRWHKPEFKIPGLDTVHVTFSYDYPLDRLIQAAKYRRNYLLTAALATLIEPRIHVTTGTALYPVPVSKWRILTRGFNQTRIFADYINRNLNCVVDEVSIYKTRFHRSIGINGESTQEKRQKFIRGEGRRFDSSSCSDYR